MVWSASSRASSRDSAERQGEVPRPIRVTFVFGWLVVGGEETEVRLLARSLDPGRVRLEVIPCQRRPGMPDLTHRQLEELGIHVDRTPYGLSYEDTVAYLASRFRTTDVVVACQAVPDVYPALARIPERERPVLIEHGGLVEEARTGPKDLTARYVGVCRSIRDAAAECMPGREACAIEIPSMVDMAEFDPRHRAEVRRELGWADDLELVGWVGRLDRKKRVDDFLRAAALLHARRPQTRFVVIGGPDAFMPEYANELRSLAQELGLRAALRFLGDRDDVPRLLAALDAFCWLASGEGMPHVIAEAGAARLPVIATRDNGTEEQIVDGVSGLFVPHQDPPAAAAALERVLADRTLGASLGDALWRHVASTYAVDVVVPRWEALLEEVVRERRRLDF